jgi:hypothetical protein
MYLQAYRSVPNKNKYINEISALRHVPCFVQWWMFEKVANAVTDFNQVLNISIALG